MHELKIFIGSSCESYVHRSDVRRRISRLNDQYEPYGLRVKVLCWEQFAPEYVGESKQQEYDEKLIKECDLAIFIFANKAGKCTLHEWQKAKDYGRNIKTFFLPVKGKFKHNVDAILRNTGIDNYRVRSVDDIIAYCAEKVDVYAINSGIVIGSQKPIDGSMGVFVTLGNSVPFNPDRIEDVIRDLDCMLEGSAQIRCHLQPWHELASIKDSAVYVGMFFNTTVEQDEKEFCEATKQLNQSNLSCIVPFQYTPIAKDSKNVDGKPKKIIDVEGSGIAKYLVEKECYTIGVNNLDKVSFVLFKVLYRQKSTEISIQDKNFEIKVDGIYYGGKRLGAYTSLNLDQSAQVLIKEIGKQQADLIKKRKTLSDQDYLELVLDHAQNCTRLKQVVCTAINKTTEPDIKEIRGSRDEMKARVEFVVQQEDIDSSALKDSIQLYVQKLETDYECSAMSALEYIDRLITVVGYYDTYLPNNIDDEDKLFKTIDDIADINSISSPEVEMMRMNYANSFSAKQQNQKAISLYDGVLNRLDSIKKDLPILNYYKARLLTNYLHSAIEIDKSSDLVPQLLSKFRDVIESAKVDETLLKALYCGCKIQSIAVKDSDPDSISEAEQAFIDAKGNAMEIRIDSMDDVFCYLPNAIAAYYIDRLDSVGDGALMSEYATKAKTYLNSELAFIKACEMQNGNLEARYLFSQANALHNLGFLDTKLENLESAISAYQQALTIRKYLYEKSKQPFMECLVAETMINLGGVVLPVLDKFEEKCYSLLLEQALHALDIYTRHYEEGNSQSELNVYKAKQLLGTVLLDFDRRGIVGGDIDKGVALIKDAYEWSRLHPNNDYEDNFEVNSGMILRRLGII